MLESGSTPRKSDAAPFQRTARWLLGAVILLILYGSLFPFEFDATVKRSLYERATSLAFKHSSRGDVFTNVLLYMPLGLCMAIALSQRWPAAARFLVTLAAGVLLSFGVEVLQTTETARVASLTDVVFNATGTAIGCAGAFAYLAVGTHVRVPGLADRRPAPVPLGFVLLWLSCRLAPFVPTLDWQKIKDALKPVLLSPTVNLEECIGYLVGWLVVAHAVRRIWQREYAMPALVLIAAGSQVARLFIVRKTLVPSELVALLLLAVLVPVLRRWPDARRLLLLAFALAAVIAMQGLDPWRFASPPHAFSWVPFKNSFSASLEVNVGVLLEKFFWYASLVWVLALRGRSLVAPAAMATLVVGAIEFAQRWLPDRSAEITDPLLVLTAAGLMALLGTSEVGAPGPAATTQAEGRGAGAGAGL